VRMLGNAAATRPVPPSTFSSGYEAQPRPRPIVSPLSSDVRGVTAALQPSAQQQAPVLTALNCARAHAERPALRHDPKLSEEAASLWRALVTHPNVSLAELVRDRYTMVAIVPLTFAPVEAVDAASDGSNVMAPCEIGEIDLTTLDLSDITTVGVAVFVDPQPEDGLDDSSAIIIGT
jgi:hypothetical protein